MASGQFSFSIVCCLTSRLKVKGQQDVQNSSHCNRSEGGVRDGKIMITYQFGSCKINDCRENFVLMISSASKKRPKPAMSNGVRMMSAENSLSSHWMTESSHKFNFTDVLQSEFTGFDQEFRKTIKGRFRHQRLQHVGIFACSTRSS